jgi:hypothetical protein
MIRAEGWGGARHLVMGIALVLLAGVPLGAQQRPQPGPGRRAPQERSTGEDRARLEQRFRQRLGAVVQRELGLSATQARELEQVNRRMEADRGPVIRRERVLRRELRTQLAGNADEGRVDALLSELVALERRRVELLEREQRALAGFLRPTQRARYLALQENLRRRLEQRPPGSGPPRARPPG